jgi:general secretion pathway protein I
MGPTRDRRCPRLARAAGFTLLEVVVALIVFALVFGVVTQIIQTGFRQSRAAEEITIATLIARSVLERVGPELEVTETRYEGEAEEGFRWVVDVEPAPYDSGSERPLARPYTVRIEVLWDEEGAERSIDLTTLRLATVR